MFEIFQSHAEQKLLSNENLKTRIKRSEDAEKSQSFFSDSVVDLITIDVSRTFPSLGIFQKVNQSLDTIPLCSFYCILLHSLFVALPFFSQNVCISISFVTHFLPFTHFTTSPFQSLLSFSFSYFIYFYSFHSSSLISFCFLPYISIHFILLYFSFAILTAFL